MNNLDYARYALITQLNRTMHDPVRLAILSILYIHTNVDFSFLKNILNLTNGNLNSHLKRLENDQLIEIQKGYLQNRPHTIYWLSYEGRQMFESYLQQLQHYTQWMMPFIPQKKE